MEGKTCPKCGQDVYRMNRLKQVKWQRLDLKQRINRERSITWNLLTGYARYFQTGFFSVW